MKRKTPSIVSVDGMVTVKTKGGEFVGWAHSFYADSAANHRDRCVLYYLDRPVADLPMSSQEAMRQIRGKP